MIYVMIAVGVIVAVLGSAYIAAAFTFPSFVKRKRSEKKPRRPEESLETEKRCREFTSSLSPKKFELESDDGIPLRARFFDRGAETTVVLVHGIYSNVEHDFRASFEFFYETLGFNVFAPDMRACGESGGKYLTYGVLEKLDLLKWLGALDKRTGGKNGIFIYGISMGCATALLAAASDELPASVKGVIADCGYTSMFEEFRYVITKRYRLPAALIEPYLWNMCVRKAKFDPLAADVGAVIARVRVPVLFIHGTDDRLIPFSQTEKLYNLAKCEKKLVAVEGARHAASFETAPELCKKEIGEFIKNRK